MSPQPTLRSMQPKDLEFAAACTFAEGWQGETLIELAATYHRDPAPCFIAEVDGEAVGMCMGVRYDTYSFLGGLIVVPAVRGQGIGEMLLRHTVEFLVGHGARSVFLDGVLRAVPLYERCGFVKVCRSVRWRGGLPGRAAASVQPMTREHFEGVCQLDRVAFGADRRAFLEHRLTHYPSLCKVAKVEGRVEGFIMGRFGHTLLAVGPWVASPHLEQPQVLLDGLANDYPLLPLSLGSLADNRQALEILRALGFAEKPDSPWRMVYGDFIQPGDVSLNFAIGSPAKG